MEKKFVVGEVVYLNSDLSRDIPMTVTIVDEDKDGTDLITVAYWQGMELARISVSSVCLTAREDT